jgi:anti-sigma factor RsiW
MSSDREWAQAPEIPCVAMVELVTDYLEGALDTAERARFESHLARCDGCDTYVEQMRETITATGGLAPDDVDPVMLERLVVAFRGWRTRPVLPDG